MVRKIPDIKKQNKTKKHSALIQKPSALIFKCFCIKKEIKKVKAVPDLP